MSNTVNPDSFAALASARMETLGIKAPQLAARLGVARTSVYHYLSGARSPTEDMIYRWARALECSPRELLPEQVPTEDTT